MLSFCLSGWPSVCRDFLWITENKGMTLWWLSPWVGMVYDWSDTRKMKRKMRVYSSSASSGLSGRRDPNRHIHFNNSNVYISLRILFKDLLKATLIFFFCSNGHDDGQTIKNELQSPQCFSSDHAQCSCPDVIYHGLWCNLINVHQIARQAHSSNLFFIVYVLGRGSRELSNLYGDKV